MCHLNLWVSVPNQLNTAIGIAQKSLRSVLIDLVKVVDNLKVKKVFKK